MAIAQNYPADRDELAAWLTEQGKMKLPGSLDIHLIELGDGSARMSCETSEKHLALNGYLTPLRSSPSPTPRLVSAASPTFPRVPTVSPPWN